MAKRSLALLLWTTSFQNPRSSLDIVTPTATSNLTNISNNTSSVASSNESAQMIIDQNEEKFEEEVVIESSEFADPGHLTNGTTLPHSQFDTLKESDIISAYQIFSGMFMNGGCYNSFLTFSHHFSCWLVSRLPQLFRMAVIFETIAFFLLNTRNCCR